VGRVVALEQAIVGLTRTLVAIIEVGSARQRVFHYY
jgi:hypothetical protein